MILLSELLDEDGEAAQQAKQMGLISKGWGRWADPRTGKVTHKTDGGRLVAVDPQQQAKPKSKTDRLPNLAGPDAFTMTPSGRAVPIKKDKPSSSKLGQIAKDLKGKVDRASTKRQRAKAGADADFDAVEKLRQITSSPQDFEKASKMYHQGHDMKDIEAQFGNKSKNKADRALKVANMSGPAVEDALNRHGIGDNWGGNVSWQHDPETGDVDGYDDEGGDYGSVRAIGNGRYMVRLPGQKYEESNKVDGLKAAVNALADANKDNF